jgi:TatA/E family protein of Tat protein translocase
MPNIGPTELIIVLVVVLLLFGSTRLPKLARSMGEASKEFKKGVNEGAKDAPAVDPDAKVTMTQAELDAMLARRDEEARRIAGQDSPPA